MSVSKNLYEILGNVEEDSNKVIVTKELTKNSGSSKKNAAPKDPGAALGASKKSNQPLRDQNRSKSTEPQAEKKGKPARNPRPDRRSQTGKSDSAKKVGKGWGDSKGKLADEKAGDAIASKDEAEPETPVEAPVEEPDNTKTLEEYLAEQKAATAKLASGRSVRQANAGAESKYSEASKLDKDEVADLVAGTKSKNIRTRARKEKVLLEIEPAFPVNREPRGERSERSERGPRDSNRGGKRGGRDEKRGGDKKGFRAQERKAPSVNLSSASDFPALGA
ncbi:hypothetical protein CJU90_1082 [Yarrowia sp. C11]|nr:hypothetical protein CKK34_2495 [Yarrowia sp. E02]KAG5373385.1 hypothetical protein CJU90_1082 [Yarrowia sp. C11]